MKLDDLKLNLTECFKNRFENLKLICPKCGWLNDIQITNIATFYLNINFIRNQDFIFLFYDIGDINDDFQKIYNNINNNKLDIISQLESKIYIRSDIYILSGIICCPYNGHYTSLLINLNENYLYLKKHLNYYYGDTSYCHDLVEVDNIKDVLVDAVPYMALYIKNFLKII